MVLEFSLLPSVSEQESPPSTLRGVSMSISSFHLNVHGKTYLSIGPKFSSRWDSGVEHPSYHRRSLVLEVLPPGAAWKGKQVPDFQVWSRFFSVV